jgi:hypothetical protein
LRTQKRIPSISKGTLEGRKSHSLVNAEVVVMLTLSKMLKEFILLEMSVARKQHGRSLPFMELSREHGNHW